MDKLRGFFGNPNAMDRLGGVGMALAGLDQGRVADLSGYRQSIQGRRAHDELMGNEELLAQFTPEQRQILATMRPEAAQQLIADTIFAKPDPLQELQMQQARLGIERSQLELDRMRNPQVDPMRQIELERAQLELEQMRNPTPGHTLLSEQEVTALGLPAGMAWQRGPDGKITQVQGSARETGYIATGDGAAALGLDPNRQYNITVGPDGMSATQIGGSGQTINVNTGDQSSRYGEPPSGTTWVYDEQGGHVMEPAPGGGLRPKVAPLGGTEAEERVREQEDARLQSSAQASLMLNTIDGLLSDPDLGSALGVTGAATRLMGPLAPDAARVQGRIDNLRGKIFLAAYESLKGGGQITEIEGQKAEAALARLNENMSEEDYRAALMELRELTEQAMSRPVGWVNTPEGQAAMRGAAPSQPQQDLSDDALVNMYLGGQ